VSLISAMNESTFTSRRMDQLLADCLPSRCFFLYNFKLFFTRSLYPKPQQYSHPHPALWSVFLQQHCDQRMGKVQSKSSRSNTVSRSGDTVFRSDMNPRPAFDAQQNLPRVPRNIKFRVLIIGRANAGKTSILQRVCDTTESPEIYRRDPQGHNERVCSRSW
jgi:hypothetical protein